MSGGSGSGDEVDYAYPFPPRHERDVRTPPSRPRACGLALVTPMWLSLLYTRAGGVSERPVIGQ